VQSVKTFIEPPPLIRKRVVILAGFLSLMTLFEISICCFYSYISGHASYYYPETWQFCMVYAASTVEAWDQKLLDDVPSVVANLGLQTALFAWIALASTFRALYHHEWIPSTIAFLCYTLFGQLVYYQNSPLILYPATMVTNLVSITKFFLSDIYGSAMGSYCFNFVYKVPGDCQFKPEYCDYQPLYPGLQTTVGRAYSCNSTKNFNSELVIITADLQALPSQQEQLVQMGNTTVKTGDVDCSGAHTLNLAFIIVNYLFVGITLGVLLVLIKAEIARRSNRQTYRQRYFMRGDAEGDFMVGVKTPHFLIALAALGFLTFQSAKLDASLNALESSQNWPLIDLHNTPGMYIKELVPNPFSTKIKPLADMTVYPKIAYDLVFNINGWLPSKKPYINIDTILLIVTTMSVIRGGTRQSVSAFRMASVSSALYVIVSWPVIVGNMENMQSAELWPWNERKKCTDFFTGKAFLYPNSDQSEALCTDTQLAVIGSLVVFIAMNLNIFACLRVFVYNKNRQSMTADDIAQDSFDPIWQQTPSRDHTQDENSLYEPLHREGDDIALPDPEQVDPAQISKV
jgi:hypothetical protein